MFVRVYLLQDVSQKLNKLCVLDSRFLGAELLQQVCRGHRSSLQIPAQQGQWTCEGGVDEIFVVCNLRHIEGKEGEHLHLLTASSEMASLPCMAPGAALPNCSSLDFLAGASALGSRRLATWSKMRNYFSGNLFCQSHHRLSLLCLVHFLHVLRGGA